MSEDIFETYDNAFNVFSTRWGTYAAKKLDGTGLCCGMDKEAVIFWAREHLNGFQNSYATYPKKDSGYKL